MGWDGNGTLRWKMGWEMAGLTDVLENGMENRKNKNGRTLVCIDLKTKHGGTVRGVVQWSVKVHIVH